MDKVTGKIFEKVYMSTPPFQAANMGNKHTHTHTHTHTHKYTHTQGRGTEGEGQGEDEQMDRQTD